MPDASTREARWLRVKELFADAARQPPGNLKAWLDERCGGDETLQGEVQSLIDAHKAAGEFIETPAIFAIGAARAVADAVSPLVRSAMIGRRLGPYRIVAELARGGMGVVYLAERDDEAFRKQVAIKVMRALDHPALAAHFEAERRILASLEHPNIARLLDAGTDEDGTPFVVMEYVEGTPIDVYARDHRLPIDARLELFRTVCDAVQYSHRRLVVHRDIKASNILVTAEGVPKLIDFGIAKLIDVSGLGADRTRTDMRALTPESASPEQVRGEHVTVASDVYSLGVLLYRLLTGLSPYGSGPRTDVETARAICDVEPVPPSAALDPDDAGSELARKRRNLAGDLDLITIKALAKEPERRYASVERFADDLRRHLRGEPVEAVPDSWRYRTGKFLRRHRAGVAAAAVFAVTIVAGLAGTLWEATAARGERVRAERRFDEVRSLARSMMFELHDAIEPLPGSTAARELLVQRALEYLDKLAAEAGDDASLQRELAEAYTRIGDVQGNQNKDNLGKPGASLESYRKALAIRERLAGVMPADPGAQTDLANAHGFVTDLLLRTGDTKGALEHGRTAVAINERLVGERPLDSSRQLALGVAYKNLGDVIAVTGDYTQLLEVRLKSLPLILQGAEQSPADTEIQRTLALAYKRLGAVQAMLHQYADGLDAYRKALAIDQARLAGDPGSAEARMDVSYDVSDIGFILWRSGDLRAGLSQYEEARVIRKELLLADSHNDRTQRALAATLSRMGQIRSELGKHDEAIGSFREALAVLGPLNAGDPTDAMRLDSIAENSARAGLEYVELAQQRRAGACHEARPLLATALIVYRAPAPERTTTVDPAIAPERLDAALASCQPD